MNPPTYKLGECCEHGGLKRQCDVCFAMWELSELVRTVKAYAAARNSKDYTHLKETVAFDAMMQAVSEIEGTVSK